ncbi:MAG: mannose-6-phosphate isomerase, class I [Bacilli bacterium]
MKPLFLKPIFQERIWGGRKLEDVFEYNIPSDHTGECWAISAHPNGPSVVKNGPFAGKTITELWESHRELFGNMPGEKFPLLTKILDANTDLSVQVHPDDTYASLHEEGELGKTECWYILDCEPDAELILGHYAKTKEDLEKQIRKGEWDGLLRKVRIQPGDFFYVPSGTIHALGAGTLVLETQQSSDTTYRVYDYNRIDAAGEKRELHIDDSIAVSMVPHADAEIETEIKHGQQFTQTTFVDNDFFTVYKLDVEEEMDFHHNKPFTLASVIDGEGECIVDNEVHSIKKGEHFILPAQIKRMKLKGNMSFMMAHTSA